jgi:hypothetical protein
MATKYTCHSEDVTEEPVIIEALTPESAAEQYVDENLEFDPTAPQSTLEIEVELDSPEFENKKEIKLIEITIVLSWHASAERN